MKKRVTQASSFFDDLLSSITSTAIAVSQPGKPLEDGSRHMVFDLLPKARHEAGKITSVRWLIYSSEGTKVFESRKRVCSALLYPGRYTVRVSIWSKREQMQKTERRSSATVITLIAERTRQVKSLSLNELMKSLPPRMTAEERRHHMLQRFNVDLLAAEGVAIKVHPIRGVDCKDAFRSLYSDKFHQPLPAKATVKQLLARVAEVVDFGKLTVEVTTRHGTTASHCDVHLDRLRTM